MARRQTIPTTWGTDSRSRTRAPPAKRIKSTFLSGTVTRSADEQIDEATKRLASIDRGLAALQHQSRRRPTKQLQVQIDAVRQRRDQARLDLLEIVELAEMPVEFMGSA